VLAITANITQVNSSKIVLRVQVIEVKLREVMAAYSKNNNCKLTYHELAELSGLSKATLEAIGSRPDYNTTLTALDTLCRVLECSISDLLEYGKDEE
jgi:DNA-binding Xre family transcriptional regulator